MNKHRKKYAVLIYLLCLIIANGILTAQTMPKRVEVYYSVSVVGAVQNPGVYKLPSSDRVLTAIKYASFSDTIRTGFLSNASKRKVLLRRDNSEIKLDLARFLILGFEEDNPYLQDGDVIFVPVRDKTISIYGAANRVGTYELVEGDKVSDIIELAMGLRDDAYLGKAEVVRFKDNHINTEILSVNLNKIIDKPECEDNILLKNDDRIFIRSIPEFHEKKGVTVSGEVRFPGAYSIEEGKIYLSEILEKCGGPTDKADLKNAYLQRRRSVDIIDPEFERLKLMLVEDMTDMEYEYFKTKSRELRGRFSTNFEKLWYNKDKNSDILLKDGDIIYIPDKTVTVTVSGQVKNPGLVTFIPNQNYLYYIEKTGGFAWRARKGKIRLIKAATGEWLKPDKNTKIEVGDMIFIPEKKEYDYWQIAKDVMKVAADIATVLIVIQNVKW